MLTTDTVDTMVDTVDTTDTLADTDTTEARGPLKPKLHPKLMLTRIRPWIRIPWIRLWPIWIRIPLWQIRILWLNFCSNKQTNKPLKLQLSGSSHSKFFQFGYNAKNSLPPYFF